MSEVLSHSSPTPESLPSTPEVDSTDQPDNQPSFRERANKFADRVSDVLEERLRVKQDQKDAYDSYAENIDATKAREKGERSQERREKARGVLRKIGNSSLSFMESQGLIPPRGEWHKQGSGKFNMNFSAWLARKYVASQRRDERMVAGFLSPEQNAAITGEDDPLVSEPRPAEEPTVELPPVPDDTSESTPEPTADTPAETTEPGASDTEAPAEPAEPEPSEPDYVERARREAEEQARTAEEQRHEHEHDVV
jgi:hypothetical protein